MGLGVGVAVGEGVGLVVGTGVGVGEDVGVGVDVEVGVGVGDAVGVGLEVLVEGVEVTVGIGEDWARSWLFFTIPFWRKALVSSVAMSTPKIMSAMMKISVAFSFKNGILWHLLIQLFFCMKDD